MHSIIIYMYKKETAKQVNMSLGLYNATDNFPFFPVRFIDFIPRAVRINVWENQSRNDRKKNRAHKYVDA